MQIDAAIEPAQLMQSIDRTLELAGVKVRAIDRRWDFAGGAPVFTVDGRYAAQAWTQWTQGFQFGCALLVFDAVDDRELLEIGRSRTIEHMAAHVTHAGVHDHAFNNLSTYGQLRRLMLEQRIERNPWELRYYELALKASAAVQAARWTGLPRDAQRDEPRGYIYSFNGPHSLFIDTMRTLRILGLGHQLGHALTGESDRPISLLGRLITHALTSAKHLVGGDEQRDVYEVPGRVAHEAIFNLNDGSFRCLSTQQGYSPFSTWTRGLAWAILGFAEELEFLLALAPSAVESACGATKDRVLARLEGAAKAAADHYIKEVSAADGLCYWDAGAPDLHKLGDWRDKPADPFNDHEPVDSSAAAIAAQGLIRLGRYLQRHDGDYEQYQRAGLTIARSLLAEPYLAADRAHEGLLLHSVYHRPRGWDHTPTGRRVPCREATMWGDYHLLELVNLVKRIADGARCPTFFDQPAED